MADIELAPAAGKVVCDERAAECRCREAKGHYPATPHRCDPRCGGSWRGSHDGDDFEVVEFPQGIGPLEMLSGILPAPIPGLAADEEW